MMASSGLDYRVVSVVLGVLLVLVIAYHLQAIRDIGAVVGNDSRPASGDVQVFYLYPSRCIDCDLNVPGQCDYCTSYYDERVMGLLSEEVGVPIRFYKTDVVVRPNVFVVAGDRVALGDARTRYNIAHTLCDLTGVYKACELYRGEVKRTRECVADRGLPAGTLIYHYVKSGCVPCVRTNNVVKELEGLDYNETVKYGVRYVDHASREEMKLINDCFVSFSNIDYVPQVLCPVNGRDLTGEFTLGQLRDFADECIEAA